MSKGKLYFDVNNLSWYRQFGSCDHELKITVSDDGQVTYSVIEYHALDRYIGKVVLETSDYSMLQGRFSYFYDLGENEVLRKVRYESLN